MLAWVLAWLCCLGGLPLKNAPAFAKAGSQAKVAPLPLVRDTGYTQRRALCTTLLERGDYRRAAIETASLLAYVRATWGTDDARFATALHLQVDALNRLDLFRRAESLAQTLVEWQERHPDRGTQGLVEALTELAKAQLQAGRAQGAKQTLARAWALCRKGQGSAALLQARVLEQQAALATYLNHDEEAYRLLKQALALEQRCLPSDHPQVLQTQMALGEGLRVTDRLAEAETLLRSVLGRTRRCLGTAHPLTLEAEYTLANCLEDRDGYTEVEGLLRHAYPLATRDLGLEHVLSLNLLAIQARTEEETGRLSLALLHNQQLLQRVLHRYGEVRDGQGHTHVVYARRALANTLNYLNHASEAERLLCRALQDVRSLLGDKDALTAVVRQDLGELYAQQGRYAEAETLLKQAYAICSQGKERLDSDGCNVAHALADLYLRMDCPEDALYYAQADLKSTCQIYGSDHTCTANSLIILDSVYRNLGQPHNGIPLAQQALQILEHSDRPRSELASLALFGLSRGNLALGQFAKARFYAQRDLQVFLQTPAPDPNALASSYRNLGNIERAAGNADLAHQAYLKALCLAERWRGDKDGTLDCLQQLAALEVETHHPDQALRYARRLVAGLERERQQQFSFLSQQQRLSNEAARDSVSLLANLGAASDLMQAVLRSRQAVLDSVLEDEVAARQGGAEVARCREERTRLQARARELWLRTSGGESLRIPSRGRKPLSTSGGETSATALAALQRQLQDVEARYARLAHIQKRSSQTVTTREVQRAMAADSALVQYVCYERYLGRGKHASAYGALILLPQGEPQWIELGPAATLDPLIRQLRTALTGFEDDSAHARHLETLLRKQAQSVWWPIVRHLPAGVRRVVVAPDGLVWHVSLACLPQPDGEFAAEHYAFAYVGTGRDLLWGSGTASGGPTGREPHGAPAAGTPSGELSPHVPYLAVFSDPDFLAPASPGPGVPPTSVSPSPPLLLPQAATPSPAPAPPLSPPAPPVSSRPRQREALGQCLAQLVFDRLPGAAREGRAVASLARQAGWQVGLWERGEATRQRLCALQSPQVLHLATHGFVVQPRRSSLGRTSLHESEAMMGAGLALTGAQRAVDALRSGLPAPLEDGLLLAADIAALNLRTTELVVLSACDSGGGGLVRGDGLLGVRRAFVQAGARNLLLTLWSVQDDVTADFMADFYTQMLGGQPASLAFARTQADWLARLRARKGLGYAAATVGPFVVSVRGSLPQPDAR